MVAVKPTLHFGAHLVTYPFPASVDKEGLVMTEWELSLEDRERLLCGGSIRLWVYTEGFPIQPLFVEAMEPDEIVVKES